MPFDCSGAGMAKDGDFVLVFHAGTGVLEPPPPPRPPLFPTRIARLNLYLWANDDDEDDEQPRFLILLVVVPPPLLLLFPSI